MSILYIDGYENMSPEQQAKALAEGANQVYLDAETKIDERLAVILVEVCRLVESMARSRK